MPAKKKRKITFGVIDDLPSGSVRARYTHSGARHARTFSTDIDAIAWLSREKGLIDRDEWTDPRVRKVANARVVPTVLDYAQTLAAHAKWAPRTAEEYAAYRRRFLEPLPLGKMLLTAVQPAEVRAWLDAVHELTKDTMTARAYVYVAGVFKKAVKEKLLVDTPFVIDDASKVERETVTVPATPAEVAALVAALPEHYRALVLVAAWGGLRSGEFRALRRCDVDLTTGAVTVARQVQQVRGKGKVYRMTKSKAGLRTVHMPEHVTIALREHMKKNPMTGREGLVFPTKAGTPISQSTLWEVFDRARRAIGRPDLRVHDLRHTAATLAAMAGATMPELRERIGHASDDAARRYLHAVAGSDQRIAAALDRFAREATAAPQVAAAPQVVGAVAS